MMSFAKARAENLRREYEDMHEDISMDAAIHAWEVPGAAEWRFCYRVRQEMSGSVEERERVTFEEVPYQGKLIVFGTLVANEVRDAYAANYRRYVRHPQAPSTQATQEDRDSEPVEALEEQVTSLQAELQQKRAQLEKLQAQLRSKEASEHLLVGQAAGNDVAVFILSEVVEAKRMTLKTLTANLTAPYGWVAFAQLWRAGLIDCYGDVVTPTQSGVKLIRLFNTYREQPEQLCASEQGNGTRA